MSDTPDGARARAADGTSLHYRTWPAAATRAAFLLIHGLGEHSGRYRTLASTLNAAGVSVIAPDLRGHGKSEGRRGHVRAFDDLLADVDLFRDLTAERFAGVPLFLFGQSLGGLVALRYAETRTEAPLRGMVLSAPLLRLADPPPRWLHSLALLSNRVLPGLAFSNRIDAEDLSHDPAEVRAYASDPLVHECITPRLYTEILSATAAARIDLPRLRVPGVLVLVPGSDPIVDSGTTLEVAAEMGRVVNVDVQGYSGYYHEPFHEVNRERPTAHLTRWIDRQIA